MLDDLQVLVAHAREQLEAAGTLESLEELRVRLLGKKGELTQLLRRINTLPLEKRPQVGQQANMIKREIEAALSERAAALKESARVARLQAERIDITLPGTPSVPKTIHPLTMVREEIEEVFLGMGFSVVEGPDVETDFYNFEALNFPKDHPARDMQDTFLIDDNVLLRTHTSPMQVRTFEKTAPSVPVKVIVPGRVYRRDDDATHSPMFHQVEGFALDVGITFGDLKGVLGEFLRRVFSPSVQVRFRPSYFPFTEPSAEVDISCVMCNGKGCRVCSHTGWLEILGAGMIHPHVLEVSGYDAEKVSGFAFGMGIERIAMLKYGVDNMRLFFENDLRFLERFGRII